MYTVLFCIYWSRSKLLLLSKFNSKRILNLNLKTDHVSTAAIMTWKARNNEEQATDQY